MANGEWLPYVQDIIATSDANVLGLTVGLTPQERGILVQDWTGAKDLAFLSKMLCRVGRIG